MRSAFLGWNWSRYSPRSAESYNFFRRVFGGSKPFIASSGLKVSTTKVAVSHFRHRFKRCNIETLNISASSQDHQSTPLFDGYLEELSSLFTLAPLSIWSKTCYSLVFDSMSTHYSRSYPRVSSIRQWNYTREQCVMGRSARDV